MEDLNINEHGLRTPVKFNVGGQLFETTVSTIQAGGTDSLLAALSTNGSHHLQDDADEDYSIFIDRDPEIFSVLLYLLRTNRLSSTARYFSKQELLDEAIYYGVESVLRSAISAPPFSGIDASLISTINPASDGVVSAFTASTDDDSLFIAHGGQISVYDSSLVHSSTIRTHLDVISSICCVWPEIAAVGSEISSGIHFYNTSGGQHIGSSHWNDPTDPRTYKSRVAAIADSKDSVFASFDCRHGENAVLVIDKSTLRVVSELDRQSGNSAKSAAAGKLKWMPEMNILAGRSVSCGAFGYAGSIRLLDPRSGKVVWETSEPGSGRSSRFGDSFADVDFETDDSSIVKVCWKSGDLGVADMRKLGDDPWIYLEDPTPSMRSTGGKIGNTVLHCYRKQVFVGKEEGLEVWSRVQDKGVLGEVELESRVKGYRRNYVDKVEDVERGVIHKVEGGGNRLFVSREYVEGIEVWETSSLSGAQSVL